MMYKIVKEKFLLIKLVLLIFLSFILIFYGKVVASGALKGLYLCGQVLIPSLFPFMVLSTFVVKSGLSDVVSKYCGKFSVLFFGVSKQCTATILLSLIGGFPVGAKGISALYESKKISDVEAEKLSYSLVCAGPGFLLIFVGTTLLNSIDAGICLYASQILSVFIMGIICKISFKKQIFNSVTELNTNENTSDALINSVRSATYSIIEMCGIVVIFSAVISLAEKLFSISYLYNLSGVNLASIPTFQELYSHEDDEDRYLYERYRAGKVLDSLGIDDSLIKDQFIDSFTTRENPSNAKSLIKTFSETYKHGNVREDGVRTFVRR